MTAAHALDWIRQLLWTAVLASAPPMIAIVVVGLVLAVLQAATQVNDQTVSFAPKALIAVATLAASGPWMLGMLREFALAAFVALGRVHP